MHCKNHNSPNIRTVLGNVTLKQVAIVMMAFDCHCGCSLGNDTEIRDTVNVLYPIGRTDQGLGPTIM